ncbi:MAG TPA: hypothetical protein DEA08_32280 [Planctomycetes bacterium]|nr:hypothetical protein [Planctomycetota bacterium]
MSRFPHPFLACALGALAVACSDPAPAPAPSESEQVVSRPAAEGPRPPAPPTLADTTPKAYAGVENVVAYAPRVYSGSVPHGEEGFRTLAAWGVDTVISVDGATPDLEAARRAGLRYVHLPIGYDGMTEERTLEIARALSLARQRGAVYVHCHHGKHRSAGAAGAATVTLGWSTQQEATARMKVSGTSPRYPGLYGCVAVAQPASAARLDALPAEFPETWEPQGLVKSMVEIGHAFDHLKAIRDAGWKAPADHPDLVPAAEAGRLADLFRTMDTAERPHDFVEWTASSQRLASEIEEAIVAGEVDPAALDARLQAIGTSCQDCHTPYRNQ